MKRISYLLFLGFLFSIIASSCSDTKTYSQELDVEQALIKNFIKRNNIKVITSLPTNGNWGPNDYYKSSSGLYFHMVNPGNTSSMDTLMSKNTVVTRFKQYTLDAVSDTISNWNTIDYPYPETFTYGDATQSCVGFQEVVYYMKRNDTEAKIIIPSGIGFSTYKNAVTPQGYDLKIKILK